MKSSTKALSNISEISSLDDAALQEKISEMLHPASEKYNRDVDLMATDLLNSLLPTGDLSDKALGSFLDSLMLSTTDLYDEYQRILTELGAPMTEGEKECEIQAMMNNVIDATNKLIERVHANGLISSEQERWIKSSEKN